MTQGPVKATEDIALTNGFLHWMGPDTKAISSSINSAVSINRYIVAYMQWTVTLISCPYS